MGVCSIGNLEYQPKKTNVPQHKGSELDEGFIRDDIDFYEAGEYERKDEFGRRVSHQDSESFPNNRGLNRGY